MVHWVYVLKSNETGAIYVGETTRLYRRWTEHLRGRGGVTTSKDNYDVLIGLYNVSHNYSFLVHRPEMMEGEYNYRCAFFWDSEVDKLQACQVENHITERYRLEYKSRNWWDVRGGKYCVHKGLLDLSTVVVDRPLCNCGYPCEVKLTKDESKLYFSCPVPDWVECYDILVPERCNFYEEFSKYRELREVHRKKYAQQKGEQERKKVFQLFIEETNTDYQIVSNS